MHGYLVKFKSYIFRSANDRNSGLGPGLYFKNVILLISPATYVLAQRILHYVRCG